MRLGITSKTIGLFAVLSGVQIQRISTCPIKFQTALNCTGTEKIINKTDVFLMLTDNLHSSNGCLKHFEPDYLKCLNLTQFNQTKCSVENTAFMANACVITSQTIPSAPPSNSSNVSDLTYASSVSKFNAGQIESSVKSDSDNIKIAGLSLFVTFGILSFATAIIKRKGIRRFFYKNRQSSPTNPTSQIELGTVSSA
jgi:hypothetical protein